MLTRCGLPPRAAGARNERTDRNSISRGRPEPLLRKHEAGGAERGDADPQSDDQAQLHRHEIGAEDGRGDEAGSTRTRAGAERQAGAMNPTYIFDSAWTEERRRLEALRRLTRLR